MFSAGRGLRKFSYWYIFQLRVRAMYDYNASRSDELSFSKGTIITNVTKTDNGW